MSTTRFTAVLITAAAVLLGACTDAPSETDAASETDAPAESDTDSEPDDAPAASSEPVATDLVDVVTFRYRPEVVAVESGTTVTFVNGDNTEHTVTAGTPEAPDFDLFDLPLDVLGDEVEFTFDEPGTFAYYCVIHPFMVGTVEVG